MKILLFVFLTVSICFGSTGCLRKQPDIVPADYVLLPGQFIPIAGDYENQCGPVAEYQALNYLGHAWTLDQISDAMNWKNTAGNLTDTHLNHIRMLKYFGVPYQLKISGTSADISRSLKSGFPVVILLKLKKLLNFHWVVCIGILPDGVMVSWGDGNMVTIPLTDFRTMFTGSMITVGTNFQ